MRQTKKPFISFVTPEMLEIVKLPSGIPLATTTTIPTRNAITKACYRRHIRMDLYLTRKIHGSWLHKCGIPSEAIDFLQGRVSTSVFSRHYLTPDSSLKTRVLQALEQLQRQL